MSTSADGVLIVARAGETNRKAIGTVVSTLNRLRVNVLGLVLNEVKRDSSDGYYYYGNYGKYYQPEKSRLRRRCDSLRTAVAWTFAGNTIYAACQWAMLVIVAKLGSADAVGVFALAFAVTAPVMLLTGLQLRAVQATDTWVASRSGIIRGETSYVGRGASWGV